MYDQSPWAEETKKEKESDVIVVDSAKKVESPSSTVDYTVKLNKDATILPLHYTRYRHGSHQHRLFMVFGADGHVCDNHTCNKRLAAMETRFWCPRCDFDLCMTCFHFAAEHEVPLDDDDDHIDDRISTVPFATVRTVPSLVTTSPQLFSTIEPLRNL